MKNDLLYYEDAVMLMHQGNNCALRLHSQSLSEEQSHPSTERVHY